MIHTLTMIERSELFGFPNLGVIQYSELPPDCKVDELVKFHLMGELVGFGKIVAIEKPGQNLRATTQCDKFKVHWIPIDKQIPQFSSHLCPNGCNKRSSVYYTLSSARDIKRYRRCPKCKTRWITIEVTQEIIQRKIRKDARKRK